MNLFVIFKTIFNLIKTLFNESDQLFILNTEYYWISHKWIKYMNNQFFWLNLIALVWLYLFVWVGGYIIDIVCYFLISNAFSCLALRLVCIPKVSARLDFRQTAMLEHFSVFHTCASFLSNRLFVFRISGAVSYWQLTT